MVRRLSERFPLSRPERLLRGATKLAGLAARNITEGASYRRARNAAGVAVTEGKRPRFGEGRKEYRAYCSDVDIGGGRVVAPSKLVEFGAERRKRDSPAGDAAALDAFARKIAKAILVGRLAIRLKRDLDRLHELEGARLGDIERKFCREFTRNEAGKGVDRGCQHVDAVGGLGVLVHAVAETKHVDTLGHVEQRGGQARGLRKQIHDDEQPPHILVDAEGIDRIGERRIVDDAAVPIVASVAALLDLGPGKLRRQAAAR